MLKTFAQTNVFILLFSLICVSAAYAGKPTCGWKDYPGVKAKFCYEKPQKPSDTVIVFFTAFIKGRMPGS